MPISPFRLRRRLSKARPESEPPLSGNTFKFIGLFICDCSVHALHFQIAVMRHSVHNHSQPLLSRATNCSANLAKNHIPQQRCDQNQTASHQTAESSMLLNALSFRESTVVYADQLCLRTEAIENPENYLNIDNSLSSSISGLLIKEKTKEDPSRIIYEKRDLVVNWIALIHTKYWFEQETFHLAVSIIDRYLRKQPNLDTDFQLLAVVSFWIAAKIQERKIKQLKVWMKLGRGFYRDEILGMEARILEVLDYQVIEPTSQTVLWELMHNHTYLPEKSSHLALYILQLSIMSASYRRFQPAIVALSSIYLCSKIHGVQQSDSNIHNLFLNHWDQIRRCSRKQCKALQKAAGDLKSPIVRKFASRKYSQISYMKLGKRSQTIVHSESTSTIVSYDD